MKSLDEQMLQITERSDRLKFRQKAVRQIIADSAVICACLALIIVTFVTMPAAGGGSVVEETSQYGSLISDSPSAGYAVVGVLAFVMGMFLTLLCKKVFELKKR